MAVSRAVFINHAPIGELELYDDVIQFKRRPWGYHVVVRGSARIDDGYSILLIEGNAEISRPGEGAMFLGVVLTDPRPYVLNPGASELTLRVDVEEKTLHEFEIQRLGRGGGDVVITFKLSPLVVGQHGGAWRGFCSLDCRLPKSRWAETLQRAGYSLGMLHRFPTTELSQREGNRFRAVVEAFQRAERHLIEGRPTDAVEECRHVLNLLAKAAYGSSAEFNDNTMRKLLKGASDKEKQERLIRLWKALMTVLNDPHHPRIDSVTQNRIEYDADEARYALSMTAATLELIGLLMLRSR